MEKIICGDSRELIESVPDTAFVISDPPYNQNYHYNSYGDNVEEQEYRDLLYAVFEGRKAVIIHYPEETIRILATLDLGRMEECVSWVYPSNTPKQSRLITWWNCKPDFSKVTQPYKNLNDKRIQERIKNGKTGAALYDWWEINQVKNVGEEKTEHPCQIPLELMRRIIAITTEEGDLVVDPFTGSGTTLLAAKQLNRNYLGFELDEKYCEIARSRLSQDSLF